MFICTSVVPKDFFPSKGRRPDPGQRASRSKHLVCGDEQKVQAYMRIVGQDPAIEHATVLLAVVVADGVAGRTPPACLSI